MSSEKKLFPYQIIGSDFLYNHKYAYLADRPRLGKTIQTIRAIDLITARHPHLSARVLIVCRKVAITNWHEEFKIWSKYARTYICSNEQRIPDNYTPPINSVTICNYEKAPQASLFTKEKYDIIVIDEAHAIKGHDTGRTKNLLGTNGAIHKTERMWFLSGTPTPNNNSELWPILYTLGITKLYATAFTKKYCETIDDHFGLRVLGNTKNPAHIKELKEMLRKIMLRRTEEEVGVELPKVFYSTETFSPGKVSMRESGIFAEELALYGEEKLKNIITEEFHVFNSIINGIASDQLLEVLKANAKSISTIRKFTALQKVEPLADLITEELESNAMEKVVVFGIHKAALLWLAKKLERFSPAILNGETKSPQDEVAKFQTNKNCRVFIGNINAAGTSVSLAAANHIYFLEEDWTPGNNAQAAMRCGGINQKKQIFVKTVMLSGVQNVIDMKVRASLDKKIKEQIALYSNSSDAQNMTEENIFPSLIANETFEDLL